mmetsp:Transcript_12623/g.21384  ORF Transcript_12623/g.21384 Transcript_12623/m.21384 type:complete len:228 (+) Transcript_12623:531-1214(+)
MKQISGGCAILSLKRSSIKAHTFIPSMDRVIVAVDASPLAVVKSIFKLANGVHPHIHVCGSLLDDLFSSLHSILREVGITIGERSPSTLEGGIDPLISVVGCSVVLAEVLKVSVWSTRSILQLILQLSRESGNSSSILILRRCCVGVSVYLSTNVDSVLTIGKASGHIDILSNQSTYLTLNIRILNISGSILNFDIHGSRRCSIIHLSSDFIPISVLPSNGSALGHI